MARDFDGKSTTAEVLEGVDLSGRRMLVTGASGGLGEETVRALASAGASVVLAARDVGKANRVAESLRAATPGATVDVLSLELDGLESVRNCAHAFLERWDRLDVLIANAAVMACPLERSPEGYDLQLATNHLGHFLLANLLLPALRAAAPSRVVVVSSGAHWFAPVDLDDLAFRSRSYDPWVAYGQSKTANALFALEFDRRFSSEGVHAFSLHPGAIHTQLGRHLSAETAVAVPEDRMKSVPQGAATQVYLASAAPEELKDLGGRYFEDCGAAEERERRGDGTALGVAPYARDARQAAALWELSAQAVGLA